MIHLLIASAVLLAGPDVKLVQDPAIVPMIHATKHAAVRVHVNGRGPYLFTVDTYHSGEACVDIELVRELALVKSGSVLNSDGQTTVRKDVVTLDEIRLGSTTFSGVTASVLDLDRLGTGEEKVYGILGFASFSELLLTFDYPGSQLILSRDGLTANDAHTIPFSVADSGSPDITLRLDDREFVFGIDTGHQDYLTLKMSLAKDLPMHGAPGDQGHPGDQGQEIKDTHELRRSIGRARTRIS